MQYFDERYYLNVAKLMEMTLPKPRRRLMTGDGEFLPLVVVDTCE